MKAQIEWRVLTAYDIYLQCAQDREFHDLNAEYGYGYNAYLRYKDYAWYRQNRN